MLGHFLISNFSRKLPVDLLFIFVPSLSPRIYFLDKNLLVTNPSTSTFSINDIDLDLCDIKPISVLRGIMESHIF